MVTLYHNCRIVDAATDRIGFVAVEAGRILATGPEEPNLSYDAAVDLSGLTLMPAFIDLHCHLRDPGYPQKETLETGMRAALKGGYGTLVAMANTLPIMETAAQVEENQARARSLHLANFIQAGAAGLGLKDETPTDYAALARVTRVVSNDGNTIFSDAFMEQLLRESARHGFLISTHCQPERQIVARDIRLLERVGGNLHVGHVSHRESVAMIRAAKERGLALTCEVTPHHLVGHDLSYRVNPPIRSREDNLALVEAIRDGIVDCLATDHAPHTAQDKLAGAAGISGIEHAALQYLSVFAENNLPLTQFSRMISATPARLLKLTKGLIAPGLDADLVVLDTAAASVIQQDQMISRSRNTPFEGAPLLGRVHQTIVGGETRYADGQAR